MLRSLLLPIVLLPALAFTQTLDPTFGTGGVVLQDAGLSDIVRDIALQPDGKIVATGWSYDASSTDLLVARFNNDGTVDNTFSGDGIALVPTGSGYSGAEAVAIQGDGKIVVAGYSNNGVTNGFTIWRFQSDGDPDPAFATSGVYFNTVTTDGGYITALVIQTDGKLVVTGPVFSSGQSGACVMRLNTNGTPDTGFDGDGIKVVEGFGIDRDYATNALALQPDGRILAAGTFHDLAGGSFSNDALCIRLNTNGTLDGTFAAGTGVAVVEVPGYEEYVQAIAVQDDGRIMMTGDGQLTGATDWNILLERLNDDGTPDPGLGTNAILWNPSGNAEYARGLDIQPDGRYLIAGSSAGPSGTEAFVVRCLAANAMNDNSFGSTGYLSADFGDYTYAEAALLQPDGKYLIAGNSASGGLPYDMMLARYDVGITVGIAGTPARSTAISLHPDPSDGAFTVEGIAAGDRIAITDATGRIILSTVAGATVMDLDLRGRLNAGQYLLGVAHGSTIEHRRFIVR